MTTRSYWLALLLALFMPVWGVYAEDDEAPETAAETPEEEGETYADVIEGDDTYEGLFTFYRDTESGDVTLSLDPAQFDKEYIYFIHIEDGVVDAGSFRGAYGPSFVFTL